MGDRKLESAQVEKGLEVIVDQRFESMGSRSKKGQQMLGYIARSIEYNSKDVTHLM